MKKYVTLIEKLVDNKKVSKLNNRINESYTDDLGEIIIHARERGICQDILNAWGKYGLPEDFEENGIKFAFNRNSGYVFLTNSDYQVAMLNNGKLKMFYSTPYSGHEGFFEDLVDEMDEDWELEDIEYLLDIAEMEGPEGKKAIPKIKKLIKLKED
jgi:hypothetical protein